MSSFLGRDDNVSTLPPSTILHQDNPSIKLPNGLKVPLLGYGTTHSGGYKHDSVVYALKNCGYRMIDTAKRYGVEREIGIAIKDSGVARSSIFIATKLWPRDLGSRVYEACKASCDSLGTDYLDSFMIHHPAVPNWFTEPKLIKEESWRVMERLYEDGVVKSIGVSNYVEEDLVELLEYCSIKPHLNQCEYHVCYHQQSLIDYCREEKIAFTGYCPLAKATILNNELINEVAKKHCRSPAQICLRWCIQHGVPAIPKSLRLEKILENSKVFDFSLDSADLNLLSTLNHPSNKVICLNDIQTKFTLPDGYKLHRYYSDTLSTSDSLELPRESSDADPFDYVNFVPISSSSSAQTFLRCL